MTSVTLENGTVITATPITKISVNHVDDYMLGSVEDFNQLFDESIRGVKDYHQFNENEHFDWVFPGINHTDHQGNIFGFLDSWYLKYPSIELPSESLVRKEFLWKMKHVPSLVRAFSSEDDYLADLIKAACLEFENYVRLMRMWADSTRPYCQEDCMGDGALECFRFMLPYHKHRLAARRQFFAKARAFRAPEHMLERCRSIILHEVCACGVIEDSIRQLEERAP